MMIVSSVRYKLLRISSSTSCVFVSYEESIKYIMNGKTKYARDRAA